MAGRMPEAESLDGGILLLETSEQLPAAADVERWVRGLGERGYLEAVAARTVTANYN
ncbi:hypothetical protein FOE78_19755 [Microlunatus elymi]|uniref:Uncharacterized protein n=2 Tax=Microlunatus elymi TaxID=2596828 RepID=A0A516Q707_9ACTN|nr:hypothetical protein FOE78_19755 [Microlunatus elymi]